MAEALYTLLKSRAGREDLINIDETPVWTVVNERCPSADYAHVDQLEGDTLNVTLYDDEYDDIGGFEITRLETGEYKIFWDDDESDSE